MDVISAGVQRRTVGTRALVAAQIIPAPITKTRRPQQPAPEHDSHPAASASSAIADGVALLATFDAADDEGDEVEPIQE